MNYIEFSLGNKVRGFKMGLGFLGDVLKHYDTDIVGFGEFTTKNIFDVTPTVLYYAHKHDCIRKGIPVDFEIYHVSDWLDELDNPLEDKNVAACMTMLIDTITKYLPVLKDDKKKSVKDEKKN